MAKPDCECCVLSGFRACDECDNPIFDNYRDALGRELCTYCRVGAAA